MQVIAAKERGETLNCDLTGEEQQGQWRAEKRRAVDLTDAAGAGAAGASEGGAAAGEGGAGEGDRGAAAGD